VWGKFFCFGTQTSSKFAGGSGAELKIGIWIFFKKSSNFVQQTQQKTMRIIAHLDMDAFFAAIEEREHPRIKGKPIVVGADPKEGNGRGVVSTANYKAREYGIHSAMPISRAWKLSQKAKEQGKPEAVFLGVDYKKYSAVSEEIMRIVRKYSPLVEQASIDEAYLDLTFAKNFSKAKKICQKIKKEIFAKEKITASMGIGPNKLISKIASDSQKPDGLTAVTEKEAEKFLEPLSIRKIPGIGPKTEMLFNRLEIYKVSDLKKLSRSNLEAMLGKWGSEIYDKARARDDSPVSEEYETKSIGEQETFEKDTLDFKFIFERLETMARSVISRFKTSEFKNFRTVTITVRFSDFATKNRSHTLVKPANSLKILIIEAAKLLMPFFDSRENLKRRLIRLIGVRIEKFK
jgi:DNA polymerase IV (DinB-like DNA polymerase)